CDKNFSPLNPPSSCILIAAIIVCCCLETGEENLERSDQASLRTTERPPDVLQAGQPAPLFSLPDADMETVDLGQFRGKKHVVLYFYPKDGTPNCTLEATDFSDHEDEFSRHDCVVLGVSPDDCLCTPVSGTSTAFRSGCSRTPRARCAGNTAWCTRRKPTDP